jgi:hypothetical protein
MAMEWLHFMAFWDDAEEQEMRLMMQGVRSSIQGSTAYTQDAGIFHPALHALLFQLHSPPSALPSLTLDLFDAYSLRAFKNNSINSLKSACPQRNLQDASTFIGQWSRVTRISP